MDIGLVEFALIGLAMGTLCGALPLLTGIAKGRLRLGILGFGLCLAGTLLSGIAPALIALVVTAHILREGEAEGSVDIRRRYMFPGVIFIVAVLVGCPFLYFAGDKYNNDRIDSAPSRALGRSVQEVDAMFGPPTHDSGNTREYDLGSRGFLESSWLEVKIDANSKVVEAKVYDDEF